MKKNNEVKNALVAAYNNKKWNKYIEINGEKYIYISAKNEFRKLAQQTNSIAVLIATMQFGRFMWCF